MQSRVNQRQPHPREILEPPHHGRELEVLSKPRADPVLPLRTRGNLCQGNPLQRKGDHALDALPVIRLHHAEPPILAAYQPPEPMVPRIHTERIGDLDRGVEHRAVRRFQSRRRQRSPVIPREKPPRVSLDPGPPLRRPPARLKRQPVLLRVAA